MSDIDDILKRIDDLTPAALKAVENGMDEALDVLQQAAKQEAPVADEDGGELRDSIFKQRRRRGDVVMGTVGTRAEHGAHVEYGTSKMAAQPFLYPALKQNRGRVREIIENAVKSALNEDE